MKTEDFANATEFQLRQKANEYFDELEQSGSHEKPALLIAAQFYIGEIERRKQDKVVRRELFLELVVIFLIALEIYFAIAGGNQQLAVLQKLDSSTGATASALRSLTDEQKAIQDQLQTLSDGQKPHLPGKR